MSAIKPIHYKKLVHVFELVGFKKVREKGDHMIFVKDGIPRPVVIPKYPQIPVFIVKNNLRSAQISREEYLNLLKQ